MSDHDVRGKSLLDLLWAELDQFVDAVQEPINQEEFENARGRAHGMAVAIALVTNPYHPDVDAIKAEAMERWELRGEEPAPPARTHNERVGKTRLAPEPEVTAPSPTEEQAKLVKRLARRARRAARNS